MTLDLPTGWVALSNELAAKLEEELRREVAPAHALYGRDLRAVARRADRDDVLFRSVPGGDPVFVVHLTWSVETDPAWPWVVPYDSLAVFLAGQS